MMDGTDQNAATVILSTKERKPRFVFTPENAREMSARSAIARLKAKELRDIGQEPIPLLPDERYRLLTLSRVRKQLDQLFRDADKATNEAQKERISKSIANFVNIERGLACPSDQPQSSSRSRPPDVV